MKIISAKFNYCPFPYSLVNKLLNCTYVLLGFQFICNKHLAIIYIFLLEQPVEDLPMGYILHCYIQKVN